MANDAVMLSVAWGSRCTPSTVKVHDLVPQSVT